MAVTFKDYYETLGVSRTATQDEIKSSFRKLARTHHPDVAKDRKAGEEKFKEINEAYEVLSDPEKRVRYDKLGQHWQDGGAGAAPPPQWEWSGGRPGGAAGFPGAGDEGGFEFDGTGFSDFFETYFGGGGGRHGFGRRGGAAGGMNERDENVPLRGNDIEADLLVTLEEALHGATRQVTLRRSGGRSQKGKDSTYQVRIPAGVHEGQLIRLAGQGGAGQGGGAAGDLFMRVHFARHPDLRVQEADLFFDLDLAPWEAVLGTHVQIPTLDGVTKLRVPAGTSTGGQLRLRGLGLPREGGGRGDLYAVARVQTPAKVTPEEQALWEQLASKATFNPRNPS